MIDRAELKALLQSTDGGLQPVMLVRARLCCPRACAAKQAVAVSAVCPVLLGAVHPVTGRWLSAAHFASPVSYSCRQSRSQAYVIPGQDWMKDSEVRQTLDRYDWDGSGDIDFREFEGLVRHQCVYATMQCMLEHVDQQANTLHASSGLGGRVPKHHTHCLQTYSMGRKHVQPMPWMSSGSA